MNIQQPRQGPQNEIHYPAQRTPGILTILSKKPQKFTEMQEKRRRKDPNDFTADRLELANVGTSILITLNTEQTEGSKKGYKYIGLVGPKEKKKLVAGYTIYGHQNPHDGNIQHLSDRPFIGTAQEEVREEFIPKDTDGRVINCQRRTKENQKKILQTLDVGRYGTSKQRYTAKHIKPDTSWEILKNFKQGPQRIDYNETSYKPETFVSCIDSTTNSMQIVTEIKITLPETTQNVNYNEGVRNGSAMVDQEKGEITRLELDQTGKPTGDVFSFQSGKLGKADNRIGLCELFTLNTYGVTTSPSIELQKLAEQY